MRKTAGNILKQKRMKTSGGRKVHAESTGYLFSTGCSTHFPCSADSEKERPWLCIGRILISGSGRFPFPKPSEGQSTVLTIRNPRTESPSAKSPFRRASCRCLRNTGNSMTSIVRNLAAAGGERAICSPAGTDV